jgi:hypothetical protein
LLAWWRGVLDCCDLGRSQLAADPVGEQRVLHGALGVALQ